jgi:protein-arginine kinase activator protein McsA
MIRILRKLFSSKKHITSVNVTFTEEQINQIAQFISDELFEKQKEFVESRPPDRIDIINDLVHLNISLSNALGLEQYEVAELIRKEIEILKTTLSKIS